MARRSSPALPQTVIDPDHRQTGLTLQITAQRM
jgi:hypothetical protein